MVVHHVYRSMSISTISSFRKIGYWKKRRMRRVRSTARRVPLICESPIKHEVLMIRWKTIGDPVHQHPNPNLGWALVKEIGVQSAKKLRLSKLSSGSSRRPPGLPATCLRPSRMSLPVDCADQQILQHLESLVQRASSISTLALLRILNLTHSLCSSLIEDLKVYEATLSSGETSKSTPGAGPLGAMLDHAMEEMFVPWLGSGTWKVRTRI